MEAERKRVANELRSLGAAEAEKIRADADRQREVIVAEAYREAQKIKGEGDGRAAAIYADAFGAHPEFYAFYRSMDAYQKSFRNKGDVLVLEPNADFFRYMKGGPRPAAK
jgi:membrane protease subunit HflC